LFSFSRVGHPIDRRVRGEQRNLRLATAHRDAMTPMRHPRHVHALAAVVIEAEDAVLPVAPVPVGLMDETTRIWRDDNHEHAGPGSAGP
jgi:hypothetical protein